MSAAIESGNPAQARSTRPPRISPMAPVVGLRFGRWLILERHVALPINVVVAELRSFGEGGKRKERAHG